MEKVIIQKAGDDILASARDLVAELGGFEQFVKPGEAVLIKPNFNTADPPPASTAIDFLEAIVQLTFAAGAARVIIGDSSTLSIKKHSGFVRDTFERAGVFKLLSMKPAPEILIFDDQPWVTKIIQKGKYLKRVSVPKILDEVDRIILLPCCKTHFVAQFTGSLKLAIGFMKPSERLALHMGHVAEKVAEMNTIYAPDLVIMDARKCFITEGPTKGDVRMPGLLLASTNRVAIDTEEVKIIQSFQGNSLAGLKTEEIIQLAYAEKLGIS